MFQPITIPFGAVVLSNVVKLKEGVTVDDAELVLGEMCNVVKNTYGNEEGGFIAGQVFKYTGFVSEEGSFDDSKTVDDHLLIVTYWKSFEQHEHSHADKVFKEKFAALAELCDDTYELGYEMLWQGEPED
ncbi:MAG: ligand-binding protein SH3 [Rhodospirillales bacterium]|nr:MAG: ligand-binding protein SH3 [Rhodospirillales bacterium]